MPSRSLEFALRNADSSLTEVKQLVAAINADEVILLSLSENASSRDLSGIYALRSRMAKQDGREELAAKHAGLSVLCERNGEDRCVIWIFSGQEYSYAAFELQPSKAIAGCYRFDGPLTEESASAA
jgi:hypothetical protein